MNEEQVIFAVAPRGERERDILLGVSAAAWEYMKDGKTHTFDLTKLGLPIRIIMFGGRDQTMIRAQVDAHNQRLGVERTEDFSGTDFSL